MVCDLTASGEIYDENIAIRSDWIGICGKGGA